MKISVIQPGARLHYAMPRVFAEAGLLRALHTDLHADHSYIRVADQILPDQMKTKALRRLFGRRLPEGLPPHLVKDRPLETLARTVGTVFGLSGGPAVVTKGLLKDLEYDNLQSGDIVYTVIINDDVEVMQRLKARGIKIVHECILGPDVGPLLMEEAERFPELGPIPDTDKIASGRARDALKYAVADLILVPSSFTEKAVRELAPPDVNIASVPYGFALSPFHNAQRTEPGLALCVGSVGRRKGHPDLAAAARLLDERRSKATVRVVGPVEEDIISHPIMAGPTYVGQVPRSQIVEEYARADVFVLPTICDSFGIVIVEAMATGLPVITTSHCGDIVRDGVDGFVVPIRDPQAIAARIDELTEDRALRARMSAAAQDRAKQFSQEAYGTRLLAAIQQLGENEG